MRKIFGPQVNVYSLLNKKEKQFIEEFQKGTEISIISAIERYLQSKNDIFLYIAPSNNPYKEQILSLFSKIKERVKDDSFAEDEKKIIRESEESDQKYCEKNPNPTLVEHKYLTLTINQVKQFVRDRDNHLQAEKNQREFYK
jgi:hypothetical protein